MNIEPSFRSTNDSVTLQAAHHTTYLHMVDVLLLTDLKCIQAKG